REFAHARSKARAELPCRAPRARRRYCYHRRSHHAGGGVHRSECGEGGGVAAERWVGVARLLFHPRYCALWRGAALSSYRHLCLPAEGIAALRVAASVAPPAPGGTPAAASVRTP